MSTLVVIPDAKVTGGSGKGCSYWLSFLGCPAEYEFSRAGEGSSEASRVGTLFHKLLELYYSGKLADSALQYAQGPNDPDWIEAQRLFAAYRVIYPADEWKVVACEQFFKVEDPTKFVVPELTGLIDMVVDVDEAMAKRLAETRKLELEPGRYLLDTKTKGQKKESLEYEYATSLQFNAYMMAYENFDSTPIKGMIANVVIRHKGLERGKSFMSMLVKPPSESRRAYVKATLAKCLKMRDTFGSDKNPTHCFTYKPCPHFMSGVCDQTPKG